MIRMIRTTKKTGDMGERAARRFLRRAGYRIKARNFRTPHGEIDIIAEDREYIVFAEVKTRQVRRDSRFGRPADAVNKEKRDRLRYSALYYLRSHPSGKKQRMDIIEVYKEEKANGRMKVTDIKHFPAAFGQNG